ncbi:MAG TPA: ankyrin repeat domain-containing protein [Bryobacteraceae bacterium]
MTPNEISVCPPSGLEGSCTTADALLAAGAGVNVANDLGVTPPAVASGNGSAAMIEKLLQAGTDPNLVASTGVSPLMLASRTGTAEVTALLEHKASLEAKEHSHDQTALMWAAAEGHSDVVRILVSHGADVHARTRVSQLLVIREETGARQSCPGANPSAPCIQADMSARGGFTPLLFAARQGNIESARALVADGANPNAAGAGYTALHAAVLQADLGLVKALLAHGANPNARLTKGTPITRSGQDLVFVETLAGATPFFLAAKYVDVPIMRALLATGADPLINAFDGTTPLMAAAGIGWVSLEDRRGVSFSIGTAVPQDEAQALEAMKMLSDRGANVNAANKDGDTALHGAVSKGYNSAVQWLVAKGAKLDAKNKRGKTPLALTAANREGTVVGEPVLKSTEELLRQLGAKE